MGSRQLFKIIPEMKLGHYFNAAKGEMTLREADRDIVKSGVWPVCSMKRQAASFC